MFLGIDIGGTKIDYSLIDKSGNVEREWTQSGTVNYKKLINIISNEVSGINCWSKVESVGIGIPGLISKDGSILSVNNIKYLIGRFLANDLSQAISKPAIICNHLHCYSLSESYRGHNISTGFAVFLILGTGVGASVMYSGEHYFGANNMAGEIGSTFLIENKEINIAESLLSGRQVQSILKETEELDSIEIKCIDDVKKYHKKSLYFYFERLARFIANIIYFYDPGLIVLGGGIGSIVGIEEYFFEYASGKMINIPQHTKIKQSYFGKRSGARGAALLNCDILNSKLLRSKKLSIRSVR